MAASDEFDGSLEGIDRYLEYFAETATWEFSPTAENPTWVRIEGKEAARTLYKQIYDRVRDGVSTVHDILEDDDRVALAGTWESTTTVQVSDIPAGTRRRHDFVTLFRVSDGLIVRAAQYGVTPQVVNQMR